MKLDASQQQVADLNRDRHAVILGAAGTGKSQLIIHLVRDQMHHAAGNREQSEQHAQTGALVLAPTRRAVARLRTRFEGLSDVPVSGTLFRTPISFAFALAARQAAVNGEVPPALITGQAQDEAVAQAIRELSRSSDHRGVSAHLAESAKFRTELRNFWRIYDDYRLTAESVQRVKAVHEKIAGGQLHVSWDVAASIVERAQDLTRQPGEYTVSGIMRHAVDLVLQLPDSELELVPENIYIDDAADLTEGALALVAACAARRSTVWAFGDPDTAVGAFQGERTELLTRFADELNRKVEGAVTTAEQRVVLQTVYRGGQKLRDISQRISERIGTAGAGAQRQATVRTVAAQPESKQADAAPSEIESAVLRSDTELAGAVAHRLREGHFGLVNNAPLAWDDMAVLCRSRAEAETLARELEDKSVPTKIIGGGIRLREHRVVRDLLSMLQHVLGIRALTALQLTTLLEGPLGRLDALAVRRLRTSLLISERRASAKEGREPETVDAVLERLMRGGTSETLTDSQPARRLGRVLAGLMRAEKLNRAHATPREMLWALWDATVDSREIQNRALTGSGTQARTANQMLDAVLALFFVFERAELADEWQSENAHSQAQHLIEEILTSDVPEDTLAATGSKDAVTLSTPQGVIGSEFKLVCVTSVLDGRWPNLRPRGGIFDLSALEVLARGEQPVGDVRKATLHDELRLLLFAVTRATEHLFAVTVHNDEKFPSAFWSFFEDWQTEHVPTSGLTLRGSVAAYRRALEEDPDNAAVARELAVLVKHRVPGAHPDQWYGIRGPSTSGPIASLQDTNGNMRVSPSLFEQLEECPLGGMLQRLKGTSPPQESNGVGRLLHWVFEQVAAETERPPGDAAALLATIQQEDVISEDGQSHAVSVDAVVEQLRERGVDPLADRAMTELRQFLSGQTWQSRVLIERTLKEIDSLRAYDTKQKDDGWEVVGVEVPFSFTTDEGVRVAGRADRVEGRLRAGKYEVRIVDLKTGKTSASKKEAEANPQLESYQYAFRHGALEVELSASDAQDATLTEATLLYVHPKAYGKTARYKTVSQQALGDEGEEEFESRLAQVAASTRQASFAARVEHHCENGQHTTDCALHIVPAASFE
jgi:superfamily I DNA/RNA helicase/RecB family exonuclease